MAEQPRIHPAAAGDRAGPGSSGGSLVGVRAARRTDAWFITEFAGSYPSAGGLIPSLVATLVALGAAEDMSRGPIGYGPMFRVT